MTVNIILFENTLFQQITHNIACNLWKKNFILQVLYYASIRQQLQF